MLALALPGRALAADADGANVTAMGATANAAADDNAAITANPGVLGLDERYDFAGLFRYGPDGGLEWGGSILDAETTPSVAFGVAYVGGITAPPLETSDLPGYKLVGEDLSRVRRDHQVTVALGVPVLDRKLSFGVSGDLLLYHRDVGGSGTTGDMTLGVGTRPIEPLMLGVALRDLLPIDDGSDEPATLAGGVRVLKTGIGAIAGDLDWRLADGALGWGVGAQADIVKLRARAGFQSVAGTGEERVTWGIGVETDAAALEYAMAIPVGDAPEGAGLIHTLSLRFAAPDIGDDPGPDGFGD